MSEYQYYEFLAIDRPLDKAAQKELRALSSRARITATSFTNTYEWGDFNGDPDALMEEWFDLHLYLANWGSRRLMLRVPERLIDRGLVETCLVEPEFATFRVAGDDLVLDVNRMELDVDRDDGSEWLAPLAPLRADLLAGDSRLLYLIRLMAVEYDVVGADTPEPLPGLGPLTGALEAFAAFFCIDSDLVAAAAERQAVTGGDTIPPDAAGVAIASLTDGEKLAFLARLFDGDPHVGAELRAAVRQRLSVNRTTTEVPRRTAGDLKARGDAIRLARKQEVERMEAEARERLAREQDEARRERLLAIARRGEGVWRDVEAEIGRGNATGYDRAVGLLLDLRTVARQRDALAEFDRRVAEIREQNARKAKFLERIDRAELTPQVVPA
jgi:hypothetical protein